VESNSAWEAIRENIKISVKESLGYFEFKKHKPWFNEGCSNLLYQRKQALKLVSENKCSSTGTFPTMGEGN
jgi:restriction endonuclease S subunit